MIYPEFILYKRKLSKWIVSLLLCCSVFIFLGNTVNAAFFPRQAARTELVHSINNRASRSTGSYKKLLAAAHENAFYYSFYQYGKIRLLIYNELLKVVFDTISKKYDSIKTPGRFIRIKTIPLFSGDDIFSSITG